MFQDYVRELLQGPVVFGVLCALVGVSAASHYAGISPFTSALILIGVFLAQAAVNTIDDYIDYRKGIDKETIKTKFSGGTDRIVKGIISARGTLTLGLSSLAIALAIGVYLIVNTYSLIPFVAIGVIAIVLYAGYITKIPFLAEAMVALSYWSVVMGSFIASIGHLQNILVPTLIGAPVALSIGTIVFVNGIPDSKVDKRHGRNPSYSIFSKRMSSYYYAAWITAIYGLIAYGVIMEIVPRAVLVVFALLPLPIMTYIGISRYKTARRLERYEGMNVVFSMLMMLIFISAYYIMMV